MKNFQFHPFHLVSPSPWPLFTSFSILSLVTSGVLNMHNFENMGIIFIFSFLSVLLSMILWWKDIIAEGAKKIYNTLLHHTLKIARAITKDKIKEIRLILNDYKFNITKDQYGYYLAGLF